MSSDADQNTDSAAVVPPANGEAKWPEELTPELRDILGRQCFSFIQLSQAYRLAGHDIPKRAEDEQAFFLHRFLCHWFARGADWRTGMSAEIQDVTEQARATTTAERSDAAQ